MKSDSNNNNSSKVKRDITVISLESDSSIDYATSQNELGISNIEMIGIIEGLKDVEAGRVHSHADVMDRINKKLNLY